MRSITDIDLSSKKVILRCDYNVPIKDGIIEDDTRIKMSLDTINYLLKNNCKIIILSHLGKIKEESDKIKNSLYPVSIRLGELLHKNILFSKDTRSDELTKMASNLKEKEILFIKTDLKKIRNDKTDYSRLIKYYKRKLVDYGVMKEIRKAKKKNVKYFGKRIKGDELQKENP